MGNGRVPCPALAELGLGTGKKARLHRILYQHGLRNGSAMFLPYDQGLEHGALGVIFGRNVWQRRHDESLRFVERLRELLSKYPS
jgi:DhnA family fructose-bisphosphate aldolase class Ia